MRVHSSTQLKSRRLCQRCREDVMRCTSCHPSTHSTSAATCAGQTPATSRIPKASSRIVQLRARQGRINSHYRSRAWEVGPFCDPSSSYQRIACGPLPDNTVTPCLFMNGKRHHESHECDLLTCPHAISDLQL